MSTDNAGLLELFTRKATVNIERRSGARFSALCVLVKGVWYSAGATIVLGPFLARTGGPVVVDQPNFRAIDGLVSAEALERLLAGIWTTGMAPADALPGNFKTPLHFRDPEGGEMYRTRQGPWFREARQERFEWPNWHVVTRGPTFHRVFDHDLFAELDRQLPGSASPFADLAHLGRHIGIRQEFGPNTDVSLDVISPFWARIDNVKADQIRRTIEVDVRSRWPDLDPTATLSLFPHEATTPGILHRLSETPERRRTEGLDTVYSFCLSPPTEGPWKLALSIGGSKIDSERAGLGRARVVAHELVDPGCKALRARLTLQGKGKTQHQFEEGVGWLLHLCGLHTARYSYPDLQHSPDAIAMYGDRGVLYVECSVEFPPMAKLAKLRARAEMFTNTMKNGHHARLSVAPLFCVPLKRSEVVSEHLLEVRDQRVGLLCAEDLEEILARALRGEDPAEIFASLAALKEGETTRDMNTHLAFEALVGRRHDWMP